MSNEYYDSTGYPSQGATGSSASMRAELDLVEAGFNKLPTLSGNSEKLISVNTGETALEAISDAEAMSRIGGVLASDKDASGGFAGLTLFKINFKNALGTITSFFTNANTSARTYTFPDKDGTVAMTSDITGTNSGTNTGDQTATTVPNTPAGNIAATTVQAAINELDTEKAAVSHTHAQSDVTNLVTALSGKESSLGNPSSDGQVLSSTTSGTRSWATVSLSVPKAVQVFTSSGTYTKTSGATVAIVEVVGGGGEGANGGANASGGGGAGGYSKKRVDLSSVTTETVTIGAGGTGGTTTGGNGGTSSFGSHCSATGGTGSVQTGAYALGGAGGTGSGGDINIPGGTGQTAQNVGGDGGSSLLGEGGKGKYAASSLAGSNYGAGGGGGGPSQAGGDGAGGIVIVTEY